MISGAIIIFTTVLLFLFYILISKSQAMIELRALIKNSIYTKKIVDFFPAFTGFHQEQIQKNTNLTVNTRYFPQAPGDFSDAIKLNPSESVFMSSSNFRASESKFIKKPYEKNVIIERKKDKRIQQKLNPSLMVFDNTNELVAPGMPIDPDEQVQSNKPNTDN